MRAIVIAVTAGLLLAGCGVEESSTRFAGDGPTPARVAAVEDGPVWFEVLGTSQAAPRYGIAAAQDQAALHEVWEDYGFPDTTPHVTWEEQILLVFARPEDACPDDLVELRLADGVLEPTWLPPPGGCDQPLIATAFAVALHRGDLPQSFTVVLREDPVHDADAELQVELPPYDGPPAPSPPAPPHRMTDAEVDAVFADHPLHRCEDMPSFTTEPQVDGPLSDDPEVAQAQEQRAAYGLASDEATVRALLAEPPGTGPESGFGFPATSEEFDEVMARGRLDFYEDLHATYLTDHAGTWGFAVLDQAAGGVYVLGFTGDLDGHEQRLAARYPEVPLRIVRAPATQTRLITMQEAVAALWNEGHPRVMHAGQGAYVEIGVLDPTREDLDLIAERADPDAACIEAMRSGLTDGR